MSSAALSPVSPDAPFSSGCVERSPLSRALRSDLSGCVLEQKFEVGPVIGVGGSSTVFDGWHRVLQHPVAIKVLNPELAQDPALSAHFAREATVTAQLRSPHVVKVYDTGMWNGSTPYTVLELLRGETIARLLESRRRVPPHLVLELMIQVCGVLSEAHSLGIVHCDIKPENLFLAELPDGTRVIKVIDFGVARVSCLEQRLDGACVGTPGYMAPEQIHSPTTSDHRVDIWAIGVVLFELLAFRTPFRGETVEEILMSTVSDEPLPLEVIARGMPKQLYSVVNRCLQKDPNDRYSSMEELSAQLRRAWDCAKTSAAMGGHMRANSETALSLSSPGVAVPLRSAVPAAHALQVTSQSPRKTSKVRVLGVSVAAALVLSAIGAVAFWPRGLSEMWSPRVDQAAKLSPATVEVAFPTFVPASLDLSQARTEIVARDEDILPTISPQPRPRMVRAAQVSVLKPPTVPNQRSNSPAESVKLDQLLVPWTQSGGEP